MVRIIDDNNGSKPSRGPFFTPARATKALPLVRRVIKDLMALRSTIDLHNAQLKGVEDLSGTMDRADYRDELLDIKRSLTEERQRWQDCVEELESIGLRLHRPFDGRVDFPAVINRRRVCLCWQFDESSVEYWHEMDESFQDRKKIDSSMFPALAT